MSRLKTIVAQFGGVLFDGGRRALIPGPGHSRNDRSVSLAECEDGRILVHCFSPKDDWRQVRDTLQGVDRGAIFNAASEPIAKPHVLFADKRLRAERIWREAHPLSPSLAERYLARRAIARAAWTSYGLRFHPAMTSLEDRVRRPALVAALRNGDGCLQGVQVTLLSRHGAQKAALETPRRVIGQLTGGAVQLDPASDTLVVAEGVETALSASIAFSEAGWALLSAANLARFCPPACVKRLIIAADADRAGIAAAEALCRRLDANIAASIEPPPSPFKDWNDWAHAEKAKS